MPVAARGSPPTPDQSTTQSAKAAVTVRTRNLEDIDAVLHQLAD
jgi:hypothetical protein